MTEAAFCKVIVRNLHHEFRPHRDPLGRALARPSAGAARGGAGKAALGDDRLETRSQFALFSGFDPRGKADMMEKAVRSVQSKQDRAHKLSTRDGAYAIAKAADHAIGTAMPFDFLHAIAVPYLIRQSRRLAITPSQPASAVCSQRAASAIFVLAGDSANSVARSRARQSPRAGCGVLEDALSQAPISRASGDRRQ
jgi:hypothetical protein